MTKDKELLIASEHAETVLREIIKELERVHFENCKLGYDDRGHLINYGFRNAIDHLKSLLPDRDGDDKEI